MVQRESWDKEYSQRKLITGSDKPQSAFLKYLRQLRKSGLDTHNLKALDLGSGTGRNSNYLASLGNEVFGMEISNNAIKIAEQRAKNIGVSAKYLRQSIGGKYPFENEFIDLVIDVTSSNSLSETERSVYLGEVGRVLKNGGHFFVRALLKDGDKNAKNLLKLSPGKEKDTYFMAEIGITERVFSEKDFIDLYGKLFKIEKLIKTSGYASISNRKYKRNYLLAYMSKKNQNIKHRND